MIMYTRCPSCQTHFRVSREQLQASSGQVRCGRCQSVFDAFSTLSAQPPTARPRGATPEAPPTPAVPGPPPPVAPAPAGRAREETQQTRTAPAPGTSALAQEEVLTLPDDLFGPGAVVDDTGRRWPWAVASAALVVILLMQSLFFFGNDLATSAPSLRPALSQMCEWLGCQVALARIPDQLFIEASDMQVLNQARAGEVLLTATIRNRASVAQELPLLEVTLTDGTSQTAARKVFYPAQYLDKAQDQPAGVGPNQEILVKLYLDTADIKPTGYRLYLFFA